MNLITETDKNALMAKLSQILLINSIIIDVKLKYITKQQFFSKANAKLTKLKLTKILASIQLR